MKIELGIGTAQSQVLTAQAIQSIKLLQYGQQELNDYLADQAERNPLVELVRPRPALREAGPAPRSPRPAGGVGAPRGADLPGIADTHAGEVSLGEHLHLQAGMAFRDPARRLIAAEIIGSLEPDGYLRRPLPDIAARMGTDTATVEAVLARVQEFEPAGIAARSLPECLRLQLAEAGPLTAAYRLLLDNLPRLVDEPFAGLARRCGVAPDELRSMLAALGRLDPRPGGAFDRRPVPPALPDVLLSQTPEGDLSVELNPAVLPRVLVDRDYYARISRHPMDRGDRRFVLDCLRSANWLARILDQRARTVLRVASEIVAHQRGYFERGIDGLRPLNLRMVAEALELHESTVSRAIANKYLLTPRGQVPLKFFFSESLAAAGAEGSIACETVRQKVRAMIGRELPGGVLSDDAIGVRLRAEGIEVSRRTIAKYRLMMKIPASSVRRRQMQMRPGA